MCVGGVEFIMLLNMNLVLLYIHLKLSGVITIFFSFIFVHIIFKRKIMKSSEDMYVFKVIYDVSLLTSQKFVNCLRNM